MSEPSYAFVDGMLDQIQAGESSPPPSRSIWV